MARSRSHSRSVSRTPPLIVIRYRWGFICLTASAISPRSRRWYPPGRACKTLDDEDDAGRPPEGRRLGDAGEPMGLLEAATRLGVRNIQTGRCTTRNLNGLRRRPTAVQKCSSWTAMASVDQTFRGDRPRDRRGGCRPATCARTGLWSAAGLVGAVLGSVLGAARRDIAHQRGWTVKAPSRRTWCRRPWHGRRCINPRSARLIGTAKGWHRAAPGASRRIRDSRQIRWVPRANAQHLHNAADGAA